MSLLLFVLISMFHLSNGVPLESLSSDLSPFFSRIVGGEEATKAFAPHMAALVISETVMMLVCGGSIISTRHVLTAAHCVDVFVFDEKLLPTYHAVIGANDWYHKGILARFSNFQIHPQWDPQLIKHDVGILTLEKELTLSKKVNVIALNFDWISEGESSYVTGWGRLGTWGITPYHLQILFVKTLSPAQCAEDLLNAPVWGSSSPTLQKDVEMCTFHADGYGHGLCHGDSGSALVLAESNQQIGIASWGFPCGRGLPDVYVRLSGVKDFISMLKD